MCGYKKHSCGLCFHHLNLETKRIKISSLITRNPTKETLKKEIAKCVVLCHNCHSEVHANLIDLRALM